MVQKFRINGIYQMKINNVLVGTQVICFVVNRITPIHGRQSVIHGRISMFCNIDRMPDDIYRMAEQIVLTPELLFYLGFDVAESLPGINAEYHYVKYITVNGNPGMIQLVPEDDGTFKRVKMNKDGKFEKVEHLEFLDDFQETIVEEYKCELSVRLETINHYCLNDTLVSNLANMVVEKLNRSGQLSWEQFKFMICQRPGVLDYDVMPVFKYGLLHHMFHLVPNTYGCFISK